MSAFRRLLHTHTFLCVVMYVILQRSGPRLHPLSHGVDFASALCRKNTLNHLPAHLTPDTCLEPRVLLVPDCVWNDMVSLRY